LHDQDLLLKAEKARENAYAPYSGFRVGAALLTNTGQVFLGCNVENAAYGTTNCAERTAVFSAVANGCREFQAIALSAGTDHYVAPCGVCRQVLVEFSPKMKVIMGNDKGEYLVRTAAELLPFYFNGDILSKKRRPDHVSV